jgi:hypothetical protein
MNFACTYVLYRTGFPTFLKMGNSLSKHVNREWEQYDCDARDAWKQFFRTKNSSFSATLENGYKPNTYYCSSRLGENVSELRPPTGLLFIRQVIYECGESRRNDTYRDKPKTSEKNLSQCHFGHKSQHGLTMTRTRDSAVKDRRLTSFFLMFFYYFSFFLSFIIYFFLPFSCGSSVVREPFSQHIKTDTNIDSLRRIRTHDLSNQTATVIGSAWAIVRPSLVFVPSITGVYRTCSILIYQLRLKK